MKSGFGVLAAAAAMALGCSAAIAAPEAAADLDAGSPTDAAAEVTGPPARAGASAGTAGAKSIDLMIDLQNKRPGFDFDERKRRDQDDPRRVPSSLTKAGAQPKEEPTPPTTGGLFGAGARPMVSNARAVNQAQVAMQMGSARNVSAAAPSLNGDLAGWQLRWIGWVRDTIQFVRENGVLAGVVAAALVVWLGVLSGAMARRRD